MAAEPKSDESTADPVSGPHECTCQKPVPVERAERRGAARTHCARCNLPTPIRMPPR